MAYAPAQLAVLVTGSACAFASLVCTIAAVLELSVVLGPISLGRLRISTWWAPNGLLLVVWLALLGIAGWQLHEGWTEAVPYLAIGAFFVVMHKLLLFCYWIRKLLRKQAAKELPTQELLTEAQRVMMGSGGLDIATATTTSQQLGPSSRFQLQVGRTDGVLGYTLYIPAEEEEQVLQEVAQRHLQKRMMTNTPVTAPSPRHVPQPPAGMGAGADSRLRSSAASLQNLAAGLQDAPAVLGPAAPAGAPSPPWHKSGGGGGGFNSGRNVRGSSSTSPSRSERDGYSQRRGMVQVLLPEEMGLWRPGAARDATNRYRVLTDSALPSPAGGPPTLESTCSSGKPVHGGFDFAVDVGSPAAATGAGNTTGGSGAGGVSNGGMLEANNPLLTESRTVTAGDRLAAVGQGGAAGGGGSIPGQGSGGAGADGVRSRLLHGGTAGGIARLSTDSRMASGSGGTVLNPRHIPSASAGSVPWLSPQHAKQLMTAPAASDISLRGREEGVGLWRSDSGMTGLLDEQPMGSSSTAAVAAAQPPPPQQQSPTGVSSSLGGDGGRKNSGGLLGGRLWQAHHTRTRSFPTVSLMNSALLQDHASSGDVDGPAGALPEQGQGPAQAPSLDLLSQGSFRFPTPKQP